MIKQRIHTPVAGGRAPSPCRHTVGRRMRGLAAGSIIGLALLGANEAAAQTGNWEDPPNRDQNWGQWLSPVMTISNAAELAQFAFLVNLQPGMSFAGITVIVEDDILDMDQHYWTPVGMTIGTAFKGMFDGNGKEIRGITFAGVGGGAGAFYGEVAGLFGYVDGGAVIRNVRMTKSRVEMSGWGTGRRAIYAGGVVAYIYDGIVQNCHNSGSVSASDGADLTVAGGVAGYVGGVIEDCSHTGSGTAATGEGVTAFSSDPNAGLNEVVAGGVVGIVTVPGMRLDDALNLAFWVRGCTNVGDVVCKVGDHMTLGGVVGICYGNIEACANRGNVVAHTDGVVSAGGVAGSCPSRLQLRDVVMNGAVRDCSSRGDVSALPQNTSVIDWAYAGGVVGRYDMGDAKGICVIERCWSRGDIISLGVRGCSGGVVGYSNRHDNDRIAFCWSKGDVATQNMGGYASYAGGVVGQDIGGGLIMKCASSGAVTAENSNAYAGGVVGGAVGGGTIEGCAAEGRVTARGGNMVYAGGVAGMYDVSGLNTGFARIADCANVGDVDAGDVNSGGTDTAKAIEAYAGGVVGLYTATNTPCPGVITDCANTGGVIAGSATQTYAGGTVGAVLLKTSSGLTLSLGITDCLNVGDVTVANGNMRYAGGIAGYADLTTAIRNCWNIGGIVPNVTAAGMGHAFLGGIAGFLGPQGIVENCANYGIVPVQPVPHAGVWFSGGLVGDLSGTLNYSYWRYDMVTGHQLLFPVGNAGTSSSISNVEYFGSAPGKLASPVSVNGMPPTDNLLQVLNDWVSTQAGTSWTYAKWRISGAAEFARGFPCFGIGQVSFDYADGIPPTTTTTNSVYGEVYGSIFPTTPARAGYTFAGWTHNGSPVTPITTVAAVSHHTLVAAWNANTYEVTFNPRNGDPVSVMNFLYETTSYGDILPPDPSYGDWVFRGWLYNGSAVDTSGVVQVASNHVLIADWEVPVNVTAIDVMTAAPFDVALTLADDPNGPRDARLGDTFLYTVYWTDDLTEPFPWANRYEENVDALLGINRAAVPDHIATMQGIAVAPRLFFKVKARGAW